MKFKLVALSGYDPSLVARLTAREQRFFVVIGVLCVLASLLVGAGVGYGGALSFSTLTGVVIGVVFAALVLNLFRLLHAGTGYPVHLPVEDIDAWRPGGAPALVMLLLGALIAQPLIILVMKPWIDVRVLALGGADGLITRTGIAWDMAAAALPLTGFFAALVAAPAWVRILLPEEVRAYERERWIEDRLLVDDAHAEVQEAILHMLKPLPGFGGTLEDHYADAPYNMRPLIYGLDPALIESGAVRFVKGRDPPPTSVLPPEPPRPVVAQAPSTKAPAPVPKPPPAAAPSPGAQGKPAPPPSAPQAPAPPPPAPQAPPPPAPAPSVPQPLAPPPTARPAARAEPAPSPMPRAAPEPEPLPPPPQPAPAPPQAPAPVAMPPRSPPPPPPPRPPRPAPEPVALGADEDVQTAWDDPSADADPDPPARAFFDMGRLPMARARQHMDVAAPFIAQFTGRPEAEVRQVLQSAPDDARVHRLFDEYKKLRSILMKDAGFALDHGLAPVVSIITQRSIVDVEKRLRAAPRDKRLTGVFSPELARRLLKNKKR